MTDHVTRDAIKWQHVQFNYWYKFCSQSSHQ